MLLQLIDLKFVLVLFLLILFDFVLKRVVFRFGLDDLFLMFDFFLYEFFIGLLQYPILLLQILDRTHYVLGVCTASHYRFLLLFCVWTAQLVVLHQLASSTPDLLWNFGGRLLFGRFEDVVGVAKMFLHGGYALVSAGGTALVAEGGTTAFGEEIGFEGVRLRGK